MPRWTGGTGKLGRGDLLEVVEEARVGRGRCAASPPQQRVGVTERVPDACDQLDTGGRGKLVDLGVARLGVRLDVRLVRQPLHVPRAEDAGQLVLRVASQHDQSRVQLAQARVEIAQRLSHTGYGVRRVHGHRGRMSRARGPRLQQEAHSIGADLARANKPRVEAKDGVERGAALERRDERRVVVQAQALPEPEHRAHADGLVHGVVTDFLALSLGLRYSPLTTESRRHPLVFAPERVHY